MSPGWWFCSVIRTPLLVFYGSRLFHLVATLLAQSLVQFFDKCLSTLCAFDFLVKQSIRCLYMFNRIIDVLPYFVESGTHAFVPWTTHILSIGHIEIRVAVPGGALESVRRDLGFVPFPPCIADLKVSRVENSTNKGGITTSGSL